MKPYRSCSGATKEKLRAAAVGSAAEGERARAAAGDRGSEDERVRPAAAAGSAVVVVVAAKAPAGALPEATWSALGALAMGKGAACAWGWLAIGLVAAAAAAAGAAAGVDEADPCAVERVEGPRRKGDSISFGGGPPEGLSGGQKN